jgi:hypothetical protein
MMPVHLLVGIIYVHLQVYVQEHSAAHQAGHSAIALTSALFFRVPKGSGLMPKQTV